MKKNRWMALLLCCAGLYAFIPQQIDMAAFEKQRAQRDTANRQLNALFAAGLYDSAISCCAQARSDNTLSYNDLELALATAYWYKNDKSTAYLYVANSADYALKLNGGGGDPFSMLYDYTYGSALADDTFLEQMIMGKVNDYYQAMDYYPDRSTGAKLMIMDYRSNKLLYRYLYDKNACPDEACRKKLEEQFEKDADEQNAAFINLLQEHKKLFDRNDVGPANEKQFSIIRRFRKQEEHALVAPMMHDAFLAGNISADNYVDELLNIARIKNKDETLLNAMQDSLCKVYHCRIGKLDGHRVIYYSNKDSSIFISMDSMFRHSINIDSLRLLMPPKK